MTQEEKAKAYDEAIERSKNYYSTTDSASDIKLIGLIFPELKESGDKMMIKFIKNQLFNIKKTITENYELDAKLTKAIDWLEKQGNLMKALQISNAKIGELIEKNYYLKEQLEKQGNNMGISEATKQKLEDNLNKALEKETPESCNEFLDEQGEQKSTIEMITPEESLGIDSETYSKIVDECVYGEQKPIKEHNACEFCEDRYGCVSPCSMKLIEDKVEPKFKEGYWLVNIKYGNVVRVLEILEDNYRIDFDGNTIGTLCTELVDNDYRLWDISDAKAGDVLSYRDGQWIFILEEIENNNSIIKYYVLLSERGLGIKDAASTSLISAILPATKEQRDLLFAKMKEAGYEWDTEKKELKKIEEKKDIHNKLTAFEFSLKHIIEEAIECGDTHNLKADADMLLRLVQKPWGEEDEARLKSVISLMKSNRAADPFYDKIHLENWLKSLKERHNWKPCDKQMATLWDAICNLNHDGYKWINDMKSLYQDLKKLREG